MEESTALNFHGKLFLNKVLRQCLEQRLMLRETWQKHPEILEVGNLISDSPKLTFLRCYHPPLSSPKRRPVLH